MKATFVTGGEVYPVMKNDVVVGYDVLKLNGSTIRLSSVIPAYYVAGNFVYIDSWGRPWVKG